MWIPTSIKDQTELRAAFLLHRIIGTQQSWHIFYSLLNLFATFILRWSEQKEQTAVSLTGCLFCFFSSVWLYEMVHFCEFKQQVEVGKALIEVENCCICPLIVLLDAFVAKWEGENTGWMKIIEIVLIRCKRCENFSIKATKICSCPTTFKRTVKENPKECKKTFFRWQNVIFSVCSHKQWRSMNQADLLCWPAVWVAVQAHSWVINYNPDSTIGGLWNTTFIG